MPLDAVADLLTAQHGVVTRGQLLAAEVSQARVDTLLRRRELVVVHPGVYLTHTGTPTWSQRSWAAVLYAGRSALHQESALHRPGKEPSPKGPIDVAVGDLAAISALASVVGARRTVADRLRVEIDRRGRLRRRTLLTRLLTDLTAGTHSVLEHGYLDRVLRPHGLPEPTIRQAPVAGVRGTEYRDTTHADLDLVVELDGTLHDAAEARDDDADRDLDDLADGKVTPRLRYRQVFVTPCRTASRLAVVFRARGWDGTARPCDDSGCDLRGGSS